MTQPPFAGLTPVPGFADPVSSWTHLGAAAVFAVLAVPLLRRAASDRGRLVACAIFASAAVLMFSMSGTYHLLSRHSSARAVLQRLDHASIFWLIASSFTPVHAILFRGWLRWGVLGLVWLFVATAIPLKMVYFNDMSEGLGLTLYLGLGWVGLLSMVAIWRHYGLRFTAPLIGGAFAYTAGAVIDFARWPTPIPGVIRAHELFHLFVIAGVACHWRFCWRIADGSTQARAMNFAEAVDEIEHALDDLHLTHHSDQATD